LWLALIAGGGCSTPVDPSEALLGGDTTVFDVSDEAFNYPDRNLGSNLRGPFQIGDGVFNRNWITAPATPIGNDGLGPTFNALSCSGCHPNNGRGQPPDDGVSPTLGLLFRLSLDGQDAHGGPVPDPTYGDQFQDQSILGVPAEGSATISYTELPGSYGDGTAYSLRVPTYTIDWALGQPSVEIHVAPRLAPQVIGLGLLQAIPESTLAGFAAMNGGRLNHVWDVQAVATAVGRFGWKANQPNAVQQTYGAFRNDIGITNPLFPTKNCPAPQTACAAAPMSPTQPNIRGVEAMAMEVHSISVAVPARRNLDDAKAQRGEAVFGQIGCAACHIPKVQTGALDGYPAVSNQTIRPFTDLLLHDMGPDLADGRPDYEASGSDWRTPPLWGIGLVPLINDHQYLLHDGRARGVAEAILWHGGDGEASREKFRMLPASDRDALVAFINTL
jgi:CxxC motif-containing protein (DUF1111 family)